MGLAQVGPTPTHVESASASLAFAAEFCSPDMVDAMRDMGMDQLLDLTTGHLTMQNASILGISQDIAALVDGMPPTERFPCTDVEEHGSEMSAKPSKHQLGV